MENPFSFTSFAKSPVFCNRVSEQAELKKLIRSFQNILIYSHRRLGKSSLILKVFEDLRGFSTIYIDLYGTTSIDDFLKAVLKGVSATETKIEKLMKLIQAKIKSISVNFSFDPITGFPVAAPALTPFDKTPVVDEVFSLIEALSMKKKLVIAFDEFQEISKYGDLAFEKQLRKNIQNHHQVSYIFCGSQKHLLMEMFNDSKRAFYKQASSLPLKKIKKLEYIRWIAELASKAKKVIENKTVDYLVEKCDYHPMYIQEFLFHLWEYNSISMEKIDLIELKILSNRNAEFIAVWDVLTLNQKKTLKLLILSNGVSVYSVDNMAKVGLKSASMVKKSLEVLSKRELVNKNGNYFIQDIMLKKWIEKKYIL